MKKTLLFLFFLFQYSLIFSQTQWQPHPSRKVPEIEDCTIGDIAVARALPQPHIRYCPASAMALNNMFPGAGHFYYVHEYGHIFNGESEVDADLFAARQLANLSRGYYFINAMLSHLYNRSAMGEGYHPRYGTPAQRAERIRTGALAANNKLRLDAQSLLIYE
jgi:hypothetical protein